MDRQGKNRKKKTWLRMSVLPKAVVVSRAAKENMIGLKMVNKSGIGCHFVYYIYDDSFQGEI